MFPISWRTGMVRVWIQKSQMTADLDPNDWHIHRIPVKNYVFQTSQNLVKCTSRETVLIKTHPAPMPRVLLVWTRYLRAMTRNLMRSYLTILKWTALARSPTLIQPARLSSTGAAQNSPGPPYTHNPAHPTQTYGQPSQNSPGPPYTQPGPPYTQSTDNLIKIAPAHPTNNPTYPTHNLRTT